MSERKKMASSRPTPLDFDRCIFSVRLVSQGISRPRRWHRSTVASYSGFFMAAAQRSSWFPLAWHLKH